MPKIQFKKDFLAIEVESGDNLMQSLLAADRPVASSCYGRGICSKCRIQVIAGMENLNAESSLEKELKEKNQLKEDMRISCQCSVNGDILIDTSYW